MDKSIIRKILIALLTLFLLVYVIYLIASASIQNIRTETATYSTMTESLDVQGYFIRSETVITSSSDSGVLSYTVGDGAKVSKGDKVASVYKSAEDAQSRAELADLEAQLTVLKELQANAETLSVTPDIIDENIAKYLFEMSVSQNSGDLSKSDENINQIVYNINERQLLTGKIKNFNEKIYELEAEISSIKKFSGKETAEITAPDAGYFTSEIDGCEDCFSIDDIESITLADLEKVNSSEKNYSKNTVGKIVSNVFWYVACPVTSEQAVKLNEYKNNQMTITMPFASVKDANITLVCINRKDNRSDGVAIFRGTDMNSSLLSMRSGSVAINMKSYSGVSVPESAIHQDTVTITTEDKSGKEKQESKKVYGVYIQYGNELVFKEVVPLYSDKGFTICSQNPTDDEMFSDTTVKVYDRVVVEGVDLYDGKIIN